MDTYTIQTLKQPYLLHQNYQKERMKILPLVNIRMSGIPEDISENLIKFILHTNGDTTSRWNNKTGDLFSEKEGKQECKCFTSNGPISFTPSSNWDVLYCLDARQWTDDKFILYRINLSKNSEEWKNVKVSKKQTLIIKRNKEDDRVLRGMRCFLKLHNIMKKFLKATFSIW